MPTPIEILLDPVSLAVLAMYAILMIWEAMFPARQLPKIKFWKLRGLTAFAFFFYLSSYLPLFTDPYLEPYRLIDLTSLGALGGGLIGVLLYEFGVYVWHRALHTSDFLWRTFHQMHHSAERLDTYGAFYFSPMDMIGWTVLGSICFALLVGLSPQAITVTLLVTTFLGMFQHANILTPRWLGYVIQRPESHTVHHAKGIHKHNYSDLPIFDILFGTFENPKNYNHQTGFYYGASAKVFEMLSFKDLNKLREKKELKSKVRKQATRTLMVLLALSLSIGCSKDDGVDILPDPVQENPEQQPEPEAEQEPETPPTEVDEVSPLNGPKGTLVTIKGTNFGTDLEKVSVLFNGKEGTILRLEDALIEVEVPAQALSGDIQVNTETATLIVGVFNYELTTEVGTYTGAEKEYINGPIQNARFNKPADIVMDAQGNMFIADEENHVIRKISPEGEVSTYAGGVRGFADGTGAAAQFNHPTGLAIDQQNNLYVADSWNHKIRRISPEGEVVTIAGTDQGYADGFAVDAQFRFPKDLAVDSRGIIYVSDTGNHRIRKIENVLETNWVTTLAGIGKGHVDGPGTEARFNRPNGIVMFDSGRMLIADSDNHVIRMLTTDGVAGTLAGTSVGYQDGHQTEAKFLLPQNIALDDEGNIYVADTYNYKIRKIDSDGQVSTIAGSTYGLNDAKAHEAQFNAPFGILIDNGVIYIADFYNHRIRKIYQD
ncbi:MAG: sterol desaturase family protein [Flavobacteriaceae bacterium]